MVLYADLCGLHLKGDVRKGHPHAVLVAVQGQVFGWVPLAVHQVYLAGVVEVAHVYIRGLGVSEAEDVGGHREEDQQPGDGRYPEHGLEYFPDHAAHGGHSGPGGFGELPLGMLAGHAHGRGGIPVDVFFSHRLSLHIYRMFRFFILYTMLTVNILIACPNTGIKCGHTWQNRRISSL